MAFEPKQFGRFFLLDKLAIGGMAEIYKAKTYGAEGFEKLLAIKRILPHCAADKDFIRMLIDEAKLSVLLSHANIVQVYDLGKVGEDFFISMEHINGVNLRDILYRCRERKLVIPPELAVFIISEVCQGLDYAHRKTDANGTALGIVHRDVSPQNILISYEGEVKIVDFGIAKAAMNISHTMAGILKGKIAYMSPEQALGKTIDYRTDLFSAGIILYECIAQKKLFVGESQFEVLKKIRTTKVTKDNLPPEIPDGMRTLLAQALAYLPKDRLQSASDMQSELTRYLYSTYVDFTPQRLAAFVRELFATELEQQQREAVRRHHREQQTSSINVAEQFARDDLLQRADPHHALERGSDQDITAPGHIPVPPERSLESMSELPPQRWRRAAAILGLMTTVIVAAFAYLHWSRPAPAPLPIVLGSVRIDSQPAGATILLDGQSMEQSTPAVIEHLELQRPYTIVLQKPGYYDVSQQIALTSTTPVHIEMALRPALGALVITSEPAGASITIDDRVLEVTTPARVDQLVLQQAHRVLVTLEGFDPYETTITLTGAEPHTVLATLNATSSIGILDGTAVGPQTPPEQVPETTPTPPERTSANVPPAGTGTIRVQSTPSGAAIYLNGRATGLRTPASVGGLALGKTYSVRVAKEGYTGWTRSITLQGRTDVTVSQALTPREGGTPPVRTGPTPPDTRTTETPPVKSTKEYGHATLENTTRGAGAGTIIVNSKPKGATVFIGGKRYGRAPLTIRGLAAGKAHGVRLEMNGYEPWQGSVQVTNGQEAVVSAPMKRIPNS